MLRRLFSVAVAGLALAALAGCTLFGVKDESVSPNGSDLNALVAALRESGAAVALGNSSIEQPFFSVPGRELQINGEGVQVFEFQSAAAASAEAAKIPADGSTFDTMIIDWIASPHFYQHGKLIALYVGDDVEILALLASALGDQFAGRS